MSKNRTGFAFVNVFSVDIDLSCLFVIDSVGPLIQTLIYKLLTNFLLRFRRIFGVLILHYPIKELFVRAANNDLTRVQQLVCYGNFPRFKETSSNVVEISVLLLFGES
ncbi:hypothetical protein [uncultured Parasutterella sp.]|uniref:hypothetical protein n=1 Tax=uncultured Parasutterella sp. TaxID=1263098 RepID=UPI0025B37BC9|nr:hypothetical protein [uncultured Parasutterella sp.]